MALLVEYCCILLLAASTLYAAEQKANKDCPSEWRYTDYGEATLHTDNEITRAPKVMEIRPFDRQLPSDIVFLTLRFATAKNYSNGIHSRFGSTVAPLSEDINEREAVVISTWVATKSKLYSKLSPRLLDSLALGAVDVTPRSNNSIVILPATVENCDGSREVLRSVVETVSAYRLFINDKCMHDVLHILFA